MHDDDWNISEIAWAQELQSADARIEVEICGERGNDFHRRKDKTWIKHKQLKFYKAWLAEPLRREERWSCWRETFLVVTKKIKYYGLLSFLQFKVYFYLRAVDENSFQCNYRQEMLAKTTIFCSNNAFSLELKSKRIRWVLLTRVSLVKTQKTCK